jgi:DNA polymerase-1
MQGSAADLMKLAMVRIDAVRRERGLRAVMLLQIHDELIFEVETTDISETASVVKGEMERAIALSVPLEVTLKTGRTWFDVEPLDLEPDGVAADA